MSISRKIHFKAMVSVVLCMSMLFSAACTGETERIDDTRELSSEEYTTLSLSGTDALGRTVSPSDGNNGKYVGMFYFLWCGAHTLNQYDINYLLENYPDELWDSSTNEYSTVGAYHYWGEPLYGYYHMLDEWVVTRHVEMFVNAGIDFLGLDVTNAVTYDSQTALLLKVLLKFQQQGFKVPQVMFLTKSSDIDTAVYLYEKWYTNETYDSLWFAPNGKPMISCSIYGWESTSRTDEENAYYNEVKDFFDVKYNQWPDEGYVNPNGFAWMEYTYPQPLHETSGMISVSVAQHTSSKMSNMSVGNRGRSYNYSTVSNEDERYEEGLNYQGQWDTALSTEGAEIVFITGWNEWQAIKFVDSVGQVYFVDTFNTDYSRDIEPMKDGYGDNYYMQTVENIHSYKSIGSSSYNIVQKTIDIEGALSQWDDVSYVYRDFEGDAMVRDFQGSISGYYYTDTSNRNDIVTTKIATDSEYAYFYVETAEDITDYEGGTNWMNIMIDIGEEDGFEGYSYLINAVPNGNTTSISAFTGDGFGYTTNATADLRVEGNVMIVRVKLTDIGLSANNVSFSFKVCDNVTEQADIMDYYVSGDCAPLGRLNYTYGY